MFHKIFIAAAVAFACIPVATSALAAPHGHGGGHAMAGHARGGHIAGRYYGGGYRTGPIYDSCRGYGYGYNNRCSGDGIIGGVINGALGGYGGY